MRLAVNKDSNCHDMHYTLPLPLTLPPLLLHAITVLDCTVLYYITVVNTGSTTKATGSKTPTNLPVLLYYVPVVLRGGAYSSTTGFVTPHGGENDRWPYVRPSLSITLLLFSVVGMWRYEIVDNLSPDNLSEVLLCSLLLLLLLSTPLTL